MSEDKPEVTDANVRFGDKPMKQSARQRITMLVENSYPADTRIRNEATLLQSSGYQVSVVALRNESEPRFEVLEGVRVYRVPSVEVFKKTQVGHPGAFGRICLKVKTLAGYAIEYGYFTTAAFMVTTYICLRHGTDAIHAHNPPDTLFLAAVPFKLLGKRFVFDHHDLCPELYQSRYQSGECLPTRLLRLAEWCTLRFADVVIATNESYKRVEMERGKRDPGEIFIVRNGPNSLRMSRVAAAQRLRDLNKCVLAYVGALNPQDGVDYLLRSLAYLRNELHREDFHCVIMGKGDSLEDLCKLSARLGLDDNVELTGFVSDEELQTNLAAADICVDPDPSSPLNDVSTWIKIMEYMAYGKPIVAYDLAETRYSAQDAALYVRANDEAAFARAIMTLMDDPDLRRRMGEFGRGRVERELQWSVVGQSLLEAYEHIFTAAQRRTDSRRDVPADDQDRSVRERGRSNERHVPKIVER